MWYNVFPISEWSRNYCFEGTPSLDLFSLGLVYLISRGFSAFFGSLHRVSGMHLKPPILNKSGEMGRRNVEELGVYAWTVAGTGVLGCEGVEVGINNKDRVRTKTITSAGCFLSWNCYQYQLNCYCFLNQGLFHLLNL